jgi:hypothetical protein
LLAVVGLVDDDAGEEGAEGEGDTEQLGRTEGDSKSRASLSVGRGLRYFVSAATPVARNAASSQPMTLWP